jgi:hypothetical protein
MIIQLVCKQPSPRIKYVAEVLSSVGGFEIQVISVEELNHSQIAITYGLKIDLLPQIYCSGEIDLFSFNPTPEIYNTPEIKGWYPSPQKTEQIPFDLILSAFRLLTESWEMPIDQHGRNNDKFHPLELQGWTKIPLIHLYSKYLSSFFSIKTDNIVLNKNKLILTLDIDEPWKYLHKNILIQFGGVIKDLKNNNHTKLQERWNSFVNNKDPFDILDEIITPENINLFFLIERRCRQDGRHTWRNAHYRKLIQKCHRRGFTIGIHPSYLSSTRKGWITEEIEELTQIIGAPVLHSRQHFLKYKDPDTFRELEAAGIHWEYSVCPIQFAGFRRGISKPFPWYDMEQERVSKLLLVPAVAMDRGLQKYQGLTPEESKITIKNLLESMQIFEGDCLLLWHNTTLSENDEWKGWKSLWHHFMNIA